MSKLGRREITDKVMVAAALLVFILTVIFVLKRRIGLRLSWLLSFFMSSEEAGGELGESSMQVEL